MTAIAGSAITATGTTGSAAQASIVGRTASGAPVAGTHVVGDTVVTAAGEAFVCTGAGTPGTWVQIGARAPIGGSWQNASATTRFISPFGCASMTTDAAAANPMPYAGVLSNAFAAVSTAPGLAASGKAWTVTVMKNGGATAVTGTILEVATSCVLAGSVAYAAGDTMSMQYAAVNTPAATAGRWSALLTG